MILMDNDDLTDREFQRINVGHQGNGTASF
jgi:hypothetical protein